MLETIQHFLPYLLHIDKMLINIVTVYGIWAYVVLFLIVFCETGLVVTPFLPGDSLIFAAGSIAATSNNEFNIYVLMLILFIASILGNQVNYSIGRMIGPRVFKDTGGWREKIFNRKYLMRTHDFYQRHGGKTIILARFIPIIRTYAPFIAGVSFMETRLYTFYNLLSAILWIGSLLSAGYFFGKIPFIQQNFSLVVYGIVLFSVLPPFIIYGYKKIVSKAYHSRSC